MLKKFLAKLRSKKGAAMVEYTTLVGAIMLTGIVAFSAFGSKVADMTAVAAGVLPGALSEFNKPIETNSLFELDTTGTALILDTQGMADPTGTDRWDDLLGGGGSQQFVVPNSNV